MSEPHDPPRAEPLPGTTPPDPERSHGDPGSAKAEAICLLCARPLASDGWCDRCQLSRDMVERIFREQKVEEARTPCAPLVFLLLIALAALGTVIWVCIAL